MQLNIIEKICQQFEVKIEYKDDRFIFTGGKPDPSKPLNLHQEYLSSDSPNKRPDLTKKEIRLLISENKTHEANEKLKTYFLAIDHENALDEIVLIMSNLAEFERLERLGLIEANSILIFKNKINHSILKVSKLYLKK